jgi:hypothetical protein
MGVTVGKYHLFKRNRKGGSFFYYWFQQGNERIIKTCGRACTEKREAVAFLEALLKQELAEAKRKTALQSATIEDFSGDMFTEGAPHLARGRQGPGPETADHHPAPPPPDRLSPPKVRETPF